MANSFLSKKIVFRNINLRFLAIFIFSINVLLVGNWFSEKQIPTAFEVRLQPEPETIIGDRVLTDYQFGGEVSSCFSKFDINPEHCRKLQTETRNFIVNHFYEQKRAYIILDYTQCEVSRWLAHQAGFWCADMLLALDGGCGRSGQIYVFVEPDKYGNWHILLREEQLDSREFNTNISQVEVSSIERNIAGGKDFPFKPGTLYLRFLDQNGKEVYHF